MSSTKTIYVGMSGGVDSSVTAALLKEQGYTVVGVYMKNWSQDLPGFTCPWQEDFQDAKRVAVQLGIDFKMYDFETEYRQKVVDYMVAEYQAGRTPNPDVMCNQEVKFKLFLETALEDGADMIATGHYARVIRHCVRDEDSRDGRRSAKTDLSVHFAPSPEADSGCITPDPLKSASSDCASLYKGSDDNKDQTYFLYRVTEEALRKTLFPIGELTKPEVRVLAKKFGLATANKKESMGICFVGKVGIKEFLLNELGPQKHGAIIDQHGREIGEHDGAIYYTIGQRHGLDVGGGLPYYVVGKDMDKNEVFVTTDLGDERLWHKEVTITDPHWINGEPSPGKTYQVRTRYRAPLINCELKHKQNVWSITLTEEVRALTAGQSAVVYDADRVVGGGIVF